MSEDVFGVREESKDHRLVVRVVTSCYVNKRGIHQQKSILHLKRKSLGSYNILTDDANNIGADEVFPRITNLDEVKDGIYEVCICNESTDWETGYIDDYDYLLVPYTGFTK